MLTVGLCLITGCESKQKEIPITTTSKEAQQLYIQGRDLAESNKRDEALALFKKALEKDADFALANLDMANMGVENYRMYLDKAVKAAGKVSEGEKLLIIGTQAAYDGDMAKWEVNIKKLLELYPGDKRTHMQIGYFYNSQQNYPAAIDEFNKAIQLDPKYGPPYNRLGYCYRNSGQHAEAEKSLRAYLDLVPNDPNTLDSYAEILMKQGKFQESIAEYQKVLSLKPDFYNSYFGLANDLCLLGKFNEARDQIKKMSGLTSDPLWQVNVPYMYGLISLYEGNSDQALQDFKQTVLGIQKYKYDDSMPTLKFYIARIYQSQNKLEEAADQYAQARQFIKESKVLSDKAKESSLGTILFGELELSLAKKDTAAAKAIVAQYKKYADSTKNAVDVQGWHNLLGQIALFEKRYDDALKEFEQSSKRWSHIYYLMGLAYAGKSDKVKAKECFDTAIHFNENNFDNAFYRVLSFKAVRELNLE